MNKKSLAFAALSLAALLSLTGCSGGGAAKGDGNPPEMNNSAVKGWETLEDAVLSFQTSYSARDFEEVCKHVNNAGLTALTPAYGKTCEAALAYKISQPIKRNIVDSQYAGEWEVNKSALDEDAARAAGDVWVNNYEVEPTAGNQLPSNFWVSFTNRWKDGVPAHFQFSEGNGWEISDVS